MSSECDRVGGINLSQGICDFPLHPILKNGVLDAMSEGMNHYTSHAGIPQLREAIARKAKQYNHIEADPEKNIIVTSGATGAFYSACAALLSPGDEVILFEPYYGYHQYTLLSLDLRPLYVTLEPPDWEINYQNLEKIITAKTKGIVINTPLNPSGKVFSQEELIRLSEICRKYGLIVFTDEIYEYILYDGLKHISPASLPEFSDNTITISGYSKTYSITGWRIGYCICDEKYAEKIGHVSDLIYVCAPAPFQFAVAKAIDELPQEYYIQLEKEFDYKRALMCNTLNEIGLDPYIPQGAYYVLANVKSIPGKTSKERALHILKKAGVAVVPGEAFYHGEAGNELVRFCFAKPNNILEEACGRLKKLK